MGMYDYLRCEMPLPAHRDGQAPAVCPDILFQTKDVFDPCLAHYLLNGDGRLTADPRVAEADRYGNWYIPTEDFKAQRQAMLDAHHGFVRFGGSHPHPDDKDKTVSVDYVAKFTDGRCEKIGIEDVSVFDRHPPPPSPPPPTQAMRKHQAFLDQYYEVERELSRFQACLSMADDPKEARRLALKHARGLRGKANALVGMVKAKWDDEVPVDLFGL